MMRWKKTVQLFLLLALTLVSCEHQNKRPVEIILEGSTGTVERWANFESKYVDSRHVDVWIPNDYSESRTYDVIYMHDGQNLYDSTSTWNKQEWGIDEVISSLNSNAELTNCIVVGVWNIPPIRRANYFPQKGWDLLDEGYRDTLMHMKKYRGANELFAKAVNSNDYLQFLVEELKPLIDEKYATNPSRAHTHIMGSSMGGLISLYAISEYPEVFGAAACLSTHWPGVVPPDGARIPNAFLNYWSGALPDPETHRIYFDYGTETLDRYYEPWQIKVDSLMVLRGYGKQNWTTLKFEGENHTERAWNKRLDIPVRFLLGK